MKRLLLFLKGMCMGVADVIPGVSGGTLALMLGVYRELVDTIGGLTDARFLPGAALRFARSRGAAEREELFGILERLNLLFLINLGAGIATALAVGSVVIPALMEHFPTEMRAFFFGLIVASVWVPFRMIPFAGAKTAATVAVSAVLGLAIGYLVTNPAQSYETTREWFEVTAGDGQTLKDVTRQGPSAATSEEVFWAAENDALRAAVRDSTPQKFAELEALHQQSNSPSRDKKEIKARNVPYDEVVVPAGTPVNVPRPRHWFVFVAGMIAICAMILPGISGSYILLILNVYFFILNALKGFLTTLASGAIPVNQGGYVVLFCIGCGLGLLGFAKVLSYLLREQPVPTLGVLVGLMVGCLRGIWPFRATVDGLAHNVLPSAGDPVGAAAGTFALGLVIVVGISWLGRSHATTKELEA